MFISVLTELLSNYSGVENSHCVSTGFLLVVSQHLLAKEVGIWTDTLQEMLLFVCFPFVMSLAAKGRRRVFCVMIECHRIVPARHREV